MPKERSEQFIQSYHRIVRLSIVAKKKKIVTNRTGNPIFSILRVKESRDFITRPMFFSPADALPYIFSSHVVSFLLFVSRPADIPDNSFPTPTWLPISRCNCHLREDLSIGLNAAFSMRTGGTAPRPRFRETCEISVPNFCAPPVVWKQVEECFFKKFIDFQKKLEFESVERWGEDWLDWLLVAIIVRIA